MTIEEAKIIIGNIPIYGDECYSINEYQEAKTMAIKALGSWEQYSDKLWKNAYERGKAEALEQQKRECNTCKHSDNGNCAYTEECHECMWESKYEQHPRWIPCSEKLPEASYDTLATDGVDMFVAWYSHEGMWQGWNSSDYNFERETPIIAWMPLPEPYKVESEGKEVNDDE